MSRNDSDIHKQACEACNWPVIMSNLVCKRCRDSRVFLADIGLDQTSKLNAVE